MRRLQGVKMHIATSLLQLSAAGDDLAGAGISELGLPVT